MSQLSFKTLSLVNTLSDMQKTNLQNELLSSFEKFKNNFKDVIAGDFNIRALSKIIAGSNIESVTYGACQSESLNDQFKGEESFYGWSFPILKLKNGEEYEISDFGLTQELLAKIVASDEDKKFLNDFFVADVLKDGMAFGSNAYIEIVAENVNIDLDEKQQGGYSLDFLICLNYFLKQ